jgi:hypothetical protein
MGGGPGQYANQNGTPPAQQHQLTDPELRLQENLQQLRDGGDMMHSAGPQQPQYQQMAHMGPAMGAHQHFVGPTRPTHSPQQMAQHVMSMEGHHDPYDPNDPNRKRSKVSRACDECRRKKVCDAPPSLEHALTMGRFDATRLARMAQRLARVANGLARDVSSAVNP